RTAHPRASRPLRCRADRGDIEGAAMRRGLAVAGSRRYAVPECYAAPPHGVLTSWDRRRSRRKNRSHRLQPVVFEILPNLSPLQRATESRFMGSAWGKHLQRSSFLLCRPLRGLEIWVALEPPGWKPG